MKTPLQTGSRMLPESAGGVPALRSARILRASSRSVLFPVIACAAVAVILPAALAQSGALQQVEASQARRQLEQAADAGESREFAPELYPGEASDVGPQSVVVYKPRKTHIEAFADGQYFWTDNVFLANTKGKQRADVYVGTVQVALAPTAYEMGGGEFSPRIGYRHQWYMFGPLSDKETTVFDFERLTFDTAKLDVHNFNAQTIFTDGRWQHGNWLLGAGVDFTRLMDSRNYDQFYREYVPRWGVMRLFPCGDRTAFAIGYDGDYRMTGTDLPAPPGFPGTMPDNFNDRTDHSLLLMFTYEICPRALVQPYYRLKYTYFTAGPSRRDWLNSAGLAIYGFVCPEFNVRAFVGYEVMNTSSSSEPDYKRLDLGGGVNVSVRF